MPTTTKTVKAYGSPYVITQTYSDSPLLKDGLTIACFRVLAAEYTTGDTVLIVLDGARSIEYASIKKLAGTEMPITEATVAKTATTPAGMSLSTGAITGAADLYVFVVYSVEA
jgi:hypothetical protein